MEILFFIGGFFLLFILIAPLINAFGSNSPYKEKSQAEKKEQALKDIKKNYNTSKDLLFKGLQAIHEGAAQLEKLTAEWDDKADKYRRALFYFSFIFFALSGVRGDLCGYKFFVLG